ncbi:MAG: hypothetical protein LBE49_04355 [Deltaproteobacteria bacterium]|jgi:hypothetical protein|nr:hypothetical protein [Deltaproteobacteria bacterium]
MPEQIGAIEESGQEWLADSGLAVAADSNEEQLSFEETCGRIAQGLQQFALAVKSSGLYPANSAIRQEAVAKSFEWFRAFLEQQEALRLFVDPDCLLFQGRVVYQDKPGEPSLVFSMFRDGLQWFELSDGLSRQELEGFIYILNRYRLLKDDDEDDLVTSMWGADFQFIKYKTANEFWDIDPIAEIAALTAGPGMTPSFGHTLGEESGGGRSGVSALLEIAEGAAARSVPNLPGRDDLHSGSGAFSDGSDEVGELVFRQSQELKESDRLTLLEMASIDRQTKDLIGSIAPALDLLWRLKTVAQAKTILSFLGESINFALSLGLFKDISALLARLALIAEKAYPRLEGLPREIELIISSAEVLRGLTRYQTFEGDPDPMGRIAALDAFLAMLPEKAVRDLAVVASETPDSNAASALLRAVAVRTHAATPETGAIINAVLKPPQLLELIELLKPIMAAGRGTELMSSLSRHVVPQVREAASLALLASDPTFITALTHLLAEPDPGLNRRIYACLGVGREPKVEKAILGFLRASRQVGVTRDEAALINAYRALGLSASTAAASEFCLEVASRKGPRALFGLEGEQDQAHRQGAILALILMGQNDTVAGLGRSFFKDLRRAVQIAEVEAARVRRSSSAVGRH